jgi:hypothetical protein
MQTRSFRGSGEPARVNASSNARFGLGADPRRALGPAAIRAASTGRTHDRTRPMLHQRKKALVNQAPSTHDPQLSWAGRNPAAQQSLEVCYPFGRKHGRHRAVKRRDFTTLLGGAAAWPLDQTASRSDCPRTLLHSSSNGSSALKSADLIGTNRELSAGAVSFDTREIASILSIKISAGIVLLPGRGRTLLAVAYLSHSGFG